MGKQETRCTITFGQAIRALSALSALLKAHCPTKGAEEIDTLYNFVLRQVAYLSWVVGAVLQKTDPTPADAEMIAAITFIHHDIDECSGERMLGILEEALTQAGFPARPVRPTLDPERNWPH